MSWILFALFCIVGLGLLGGGLYYWVKEKADAESVKLYRIISVIGALLIVGALLFKFVLF